jgi:hypothetical protein
MSTVEKKQDAFKGRSAPVAPEAFKGRMGSAGGIGGSGIYGGIGAGVVCDSKDTSFYCMFIKFVTVIIYLCLLYIIFSTVYNFFKTTKLGRRIFGGR